MRSGSGKEFFPPSLFFGLKKGWCGVSGVGRWQKKQRKKSCCLRNGRGGGGEQETRSKSLPSSLARPFLPSPPSPMNFSGRPHTSSLPCGKRGGGGRGKFLRPLVARSIFLFHRCAEESGRSVWLRREFSIFYMSPFHFRAMATLKNVSPASFSSPSSYPRIDEHPPTLFLPPTPPFPQSLFREAPPRERLRRRCPKIPLPSFPPVPPLPTLSPFKL